MAASSGRKIRISLGAVPTPVAGAKTDSFTIGNEPVDVTDKDSLGWRKLLADAGSRTIDASVEGVLIDDTLIALAAGSASALLDAATIEVEDIGTFTGNFFLNNVEIGGALDGEITFSGSLQSGGEITYTAAV